MSTIATTVIRHPKERLSKCSLTPLHGRPEMTFIIWSEQLRFEASEFTLLSVDAPPLSAADASRPLLILDSTWKLLPSLERCLTGAPYRRSIPPGVETAYPRISKDASDPHGGLASVEALYVARTMLGDADPTLLDRYHWGAAFLTKLEAHPLLEGLS